MNIYIIAGEPSGDLLASGLMKALIKANPDIKFKGVGGESMNELQFKTLFNISEISVMGIFEVLPRLRLILKRIKECTDEIESWQPDVIVTVDSWGFVSTLINKLKKRGVNIPIVHYVAPQVWAWKRGRAKRVAKIIDRLMTLLPNEGQYFDKYGLQCDFVGHPVLERISSFHGDEAKFREQHNISKDKEIITLLPGSRKSEVKRLIPIFKCAIQQIKENRGDIHILVPTVATVKDYVIKEFSTMGIPTTVVLGQENRNNAFNISKFAIAASGTVSLELTALGVPHIVAYKFNFLTNILAKLFVKVPFANLINLIGNREIIPEFMLYKCKSTLIAKRALSILDSNQIMQQQVRDAQEILKKLRPAEILPSERAAQIVIEVAKESTK